MQRNYNCNSNTFIKIKPCFSKLRDWIALIAFDFGKDENRLGLTDARDGCDALVGRESSGQIIFL